MERSVSPEDEGRTCPVLSSLSAPVSPPRRRASASKISESRPWCPSGLSKAAQEEPAGSPPNLAAIEAGEVQVTDHLAIFSSRLRECTRSAPPQAVLSRLPVADWVELYQRNLHPGGRHFVIHQHDHPIAGPHYDLRLQFSGSSSVSWSIMYGLPGDPNSQRLNRNATETRVHCLWNHLIETASPNTGSMLIWDTGVYEILPYVEETQPETDDSQSERSGASQPPSDQRSDSEKLREGFRNRKIRLRLHGTRLPPNYTIILRLDRGSDFARPASTQRKRRRRFQSARSVKRRRSTSSPSASPSGNNNNNSPRTSPKDASADPGEDSSEADSTADTDEEMDRQIRANNAYPGSTNSIGSIHQRRWFITLDRANSGFVPEHSTSSGKKRWVQKQDPGKDEPAGFEPFYVRGPDVERSVVTGRLGRDIFEDEGVKDFARRRGWRAVLN